MLRASAYVRLSSRCLTLLFTAMFFPLALLACHSNLLWSWSCRGEGFCVFSDIAVAANVALRDYPTLVKQILIIDLDVHQVHNC